MSIIDPHIRRIENLHEYLEAEGLEVVKGHWRRGDPYPLLFVRPKGSGQVPDFISAPACRCGHGVTAHDFNGGPCLVALCACHNYDPRAAR